MVLASPMAVFSSNCNRSQCESVSRAGDEVHSGHLELLRQLRPESADTAELLTVHVVKARLLVYG